MTSAQTFPGCCPTRPHALSPLKGLLRLPVKELDTDTYPFYTPLVPHELSVLEPGETLEAPPPPCSFDLGGNPLDADGNTDTNHHVAEYILKAHRRTKISNAQTLARVGQQHEDMDTSSAKRVRFYKVSTAFFRNDVTGIASDEEDIELFPSDQEGELPHPLDVETVAGNVLLKIMTPYIDIHSTVNKGFTKWISENTQDVDDHIKAELDGMPQGQEEEESKVYITKLSELRAEFRISFKVKVVIACIGLCERLISSLKKMHEDRVEAAKTQNVDYFDILWGKRKRHEQDDKFDEDEYHEQFFACLPKVTPIPFSRKEAGTSELAHSKKLLGGLKELLPKLEAEAAKSSALARGV